MAGVDDPRVAAARFLQRYVRSKKARKAFELLTSRETINKLKALFLDPRAIAAGAEKSPLYSLATLAARDALRTHASVVSALADAWESIQEACSLVAPDEPDTPARSISVIQRGASRRFSAVGAGDFSLDQASYMRLSRKVYLACAAAERSAEMSPSDFLGIAKADWAAESGGGGCVRQSAFQQSWFELADVYTTAVDGKEYAKWIRNFTAAIIDRSGGKAVFRLDHELLEKV